MIDNVILNQLANQNKAPCDLIKKRSEINGLLDARKNAQLITGMPSKLPTDNIGSTSEIDFLSERTASSSTKES